MSIKLRKRKSKEARLEPPGPDTSDKDKMDEPEKIEVPEPPVEPQVEPKITAPQEEIPKVEVDYLRKYQYRKGAIFGSPQSDPQPGSKAELMKAALLKQPKVRMYIELDGRDKSIPLSVNLNGYRLDYPRQTYVDVPEQVANEIANSMKQRNQALERQRIDGNSDLQAALY